MKSKKTQPSPTGEDEASVKGPRWFRSLVKWDWFISEAPLRMKGFKAGQISYEPRACIDAGLSAGYIELIDKPANAHVGKDGRVILDGSS